MTERCPASPWERDWIEYEELHYDRPKRAEQPSKGKERWFKIIEPNAFVKAWSELQRLADEKGFLPNGKVGNHELTLVLPRKLDHTLAGRFRRRNIPFSRVHTRVPLGGILHGNTG